MKVMWEMESTDQDTSIEKANAIINSLVPNRCSRCYEDDMERALLELAEIRDYINVYIRYRNNERRQ